MVAVPIVLNTIETARKGSFEQTVNSVVKASELYQARIEVDNELTECRYFSFSSDVTTPTVRDNKTYYPVKELSLKGKVPTDGEVKVCLDTITIDASDGTYSAKYEGDKVNIVKGDLASSDLTIPIIDTFNVSSTIDKITVTISAHSQSVGGVISNYYYKINDGDYIKTTDKSYIFDELNPNTEYTITIKVENKSGLTAEDSKKVTTSSFGELTIDVENASEWTSSKIVTLTGTTEEYKKEYKIRKYNETTLQLEESEVLEYSKPFILEVMATQEYPAMIIAWYNYDGVISEEQTTKITKIDTSAPTTTAPAVTASEASPTKVASVVIRQTDNESGLDNSTIEYGYSLSADSGYTWQTSATFSDLTSGKTYYFKTRVANNAGTKVESLSTKHQVTALGSCSVTPLTSGWSTSKDVRITGSQTGAQLQYQIGGTADDKWNNISNNGTKNITTNTKVYCRLWDGKTAGGTGVGEVNSIDTTGPTTTAPSVTASTTKPTKEASVDINQTDAESNLNNSTIEYGYSLSADSGYTWQTSATFNNLVAGKTYYFKTRVANNAGTKVESLSTKHQVEGIGSCSVTPLTSGWSTSKDVRITGSQTGTQLQYQIGGTADDKWNNISNNGTKNITTNTKVYCRLWDGKTAGGTGVGEVNNIDTTGPTTTAPSVTASTTKPTKEAIVSIKQTDAESNLNNSTIEYGYSLSADSGYTWQTSATFSNLVAGKTYYFKTRVANNAGTKVESLSTKHQVTALGSCSVTPLTSGWSTSKDVRITGSQTGAQLQYQIGGTADDKWNNISNNGTKNITTNTKVYCRLWDGKTAGGTGVGEVNNIDTTAPSNTAPTVSQASDANSAALSITNKQTDGESNLKSGTLSYGYSTSSTGTYTWQTSNKFTNLTPGKTYYFKTKVTNNAGLQTISNYAQGSVTYTGISAGSYSAGASVRYAGVDWYVISDNGDNVTLITKSNISTGKFSESSLEWSGSIAQTTVNNWLNNNSTLKADRNARALKADSTTGSQIRLPRSNELSTKIPNSSGTAFWTLTKYSEVSNLKSTSAPLMVIGDSTGVAVNDYELTNKEGYYQGYGNSIPGTTRYSSYEADYLAAVPSLAEYKRVTRILPVSGYYSKNYAQQASSSNRSVCTTSGISEYSISTTVYYAKGDSTCKNRVYFETVTETNTKGIGYRPVITVLEK